MRIQDFLAQSRVMRATGVIALSLALTTPAPAGFFDFLFGDDSGKSESKRQKQDDGFPGFPNPFEPERAAAPSPQPQTGADTGGRSNFTHCVRLCDGRYFPLLNRGGNSPVQMCQAFCPASQTKVFFGGNIDRAISMDGERYSELRTAYAYRKALSPDCTCNGRDPAGLAPVELSMDATLRAGDIVATGTGLVAYRGRGAARSASDFMPVANYTGLTAEARARLGEMKVAPASQGVDPEYTMSTDAMSTESSTPRLPQDR